MENNEVGKSLKHNREKMNMSQSELANKINTTRQCISSWELGRTQPDAEAFKKLSEILKCPINVLMGVSTAQIDIQLIEEKMRYLDNPTLDRIIKYAEYLKTVQREPTAEEMYEAFKDHLK